MSKKFRFLSCLTAVFALALMAVSPVAFAHHKEGHEQGSASSDDTKGNDRKSGYEDNSSTPQDTNHGKGSDKDGDADSDPATTDEDGHTTTNDQPNAHPSGKDKDGEAGGSGNQGKAESNPDDSKGPMRYEGVQGDDKPGGPGGTDLDDQDGNNGCGNDDDFDDDNNGWCGKPDRTKPKDVTKPSEVTKPKICPNGSEMPASAKCDAIKGSPDVVEGEVIEVDENPSVPEETVLGERIERAEQPAAPSVLGVRLSPALSEPVEVAGAVLPFTGGEALIFLVAGLALIGAGVAALRFRSNES